MHQFGTLFLFSAGCTYTVNGGPIDDLSANGCGTPTATNYTCTLGMRGVDVTRIKAQIQMAKNGALIWILYSAKRRLCLNTMCLNLNFEIMQTV